MLRGRPATASRSHKAARHRLRPLQIEGARALEMKNERTAVHSSSSDALSRDTMKIIAGTGKPSGTEGADVLANWITAQSGQWKSTPPLDSVRLGLGRARQGRAGLTRRSRWRRWCAWGHRQIINVAEGQRNLQRQRGKRQGVPKRIFDRNQRIASRSPISCSQAGVTPRAPPNLNNVTKQDGQGVSIV